MENWNSGNTVIFYGKDGDLTGPDGEHAEISMLALYLLQSSLAHINTLRLRDPSSTTASAPTNAAPRSSPCCRG